MKEKFFYSTFTLRKVLEGITNFHTEGFVNFITNSSEECEPNSLFVPLRANRDGHQFIPEALERGASLFLCEKNHPILDKLSTSHRQKAIFVNNTLAALGKLAEFHRNRFNPFVIGITGSSGKTTTKEFFKNALSYLGDEKLVASEKNYNNEIGVPFTLFKINEKTKVVVCEMGMNHRFEISRLTQIVKPDLSFITSIGPAHIENLGSIQNIARAKIEIIESMKNGFLFIPEDIEQKEIIEKKIRKSNVELITYSLSASSYVQIIAEKPTGFLLKILGKEISWELPGKKLLWNLCGVVHALVFSGFSKQGIIEGISKFQPENKRNVWIYKYFKILDDTYNANPDSMKSSLEALLQAGKENKTYAILGDMKELGEFSKHYHIEVGKYAKSLGLSGLFTFGTEAIWIWDGFLENSDLKPLHFTDDEVGINNLITILKNQVEKESYILVKGSRSMRMERIVERIVKEFS